MAVLVLACSAPLPSLENFDAETWKQDRNGCKHQRLAFTQELLNQKQKLLGLDEIRIVKVLGPPDRNELYKRSQKFYYYFLEPSDECESPSNGARKLVVRFNAVGLAKEVVTE
jgi:hypothetical protein